MFRWFETLVDPYAPHPREDVPPTRLWPFLWSYSGPFLRVFAVTAAVAVAVAAVEIWLISYMGRLIDLLSAASPATFLADHGTELALVAAFVLLIRPALQMLDVLLLNNAILPNFGTLMRWRAHGHVLRQSVGWFERDFAGRIANRIMQAPPAAGEAVFQVFDAIAFALAYLIGAGVLLAGADPRLLVPLALWALLYAALVRWTVTRVGPASKASADARSMTTGRVVDAYTNIHSVKLFAHEGAELAHARDAIETTRVTFQREMRLFTIMDVALVILNGLLIVGVVGWAILLWVQGGASTGVVAAATALVLRLNAMTGWIMWAVTSFFRSLGVVEEGMETIAQPIALTDADDARPLALTEGAVDFDGVTHTYGTGKGGVRDLTLRVAPGEKLGIVGRSGAGKSTLVSSCCASTTPRAARSASTARTSATSPRRACATPSAWCSRTARSCTARSATTSVTAAPAPRTPRWSAPHARPRPTTSSATSPTRRGAPATTPMSASGASSSRAASASASRSPA